LRFEVDNAFATDETFGRVVANRSVAENTRTAAGCISACGRCAVANDAMVFSSSLASFEVWHAVAYTALPPRVRFIDVTVIPFGWCEL
jgi:hypothetical protein